MVDHVAHSFASKAKFRNQKEAMISYGNEAMIQLRIFQSENLQTKIREASKSLRWATTGLQTKVAHREPTLRQKKTMVAHVAHSSAYKSKFRNQKEAIISYGNEAMIKLKNFQSENLLTIIREASKSLRGATTGLQTKVAHREPTLRQKKTMVAHVAHSFVSKTKFRNQKEAMISDGHEEMIKLRNFQSENLLTKIREASKCLRWATSGLQRKVAHRKPTIRQKKTMVAHVAHSFAIQTKSRNQKEAMISYGNEAIIKLRNFQSENLLTKIREASKSLRGASSGLQRKVADR